MATLSIVNNNTWSDLREMYDSVHTVTPLIVSTIGRTLRPRPFSDVYRLRFAAHRAVRTAADVCVAAPT